MNVEEKVEDLNAETFSKMRNLRLLKICNVRLPQGLNSLSSDLRLMDWPECFYFFGGKNMFIIVEFSLFGCFSMLTEFKVAKNHQPQRF